MLHDDLERALRDSIQASEWAVVATLDDEPVYISGKTLWPTGAGCPWLVGTDLIKKCSREFLVTTRALADRMASENDLLTNLVAAENETSIRWLRWLGFYVDDTQPVYVREGGLPFYIFSRD